VRSRDRIFMASLYLITSQHRRLGPQPSSETNPAPPNLWRNSNGHVSIRDVIVDLPLHDRDSFEGLSLRRFLRPRFQKDSYCGFQCTLSHIPSGDDAGIFVQHIQTVDVKTTKQIKRAAMDRWKEILPSNCSLRDDSQLLTSLAWFSLACSAERCAMLTCGFDDIRPNSSTVARKVAVVLHCPIASRKIDPKRGYVRISCELDSVRAEVTCFDCIQTPTTSMLQRTVPFDFVGQSDHVTGQLSLRPPRLGMAPGAQALRELSSLSFVHSGGRGAIPRCTLGQIMACISTDLNDGTRKNLSPSLVREVSGASFLGIGFCQVQAECRKCFASLRFPSQRVKNAPTPSYWNCPRPTDSRRPPFRSFDTPLQCPKGHDVKKFGAIKWECSGTIDDGTGQAKLYAERDAALLLLGISSIQFKDEISLIEEGARQDENGVVFSKAVVPNQSLRHAVTQAMENVKKKNSGGNLNVSLVLEQMNAVPKANYLLQRYCRMANHPSLRSLTYFVRCKPVSDNSCGTVHQTEIRCSAPGRRFRDTRGGTAPVAHGTNFSYSLPPLKLTLVDAMAPASIRQHAKH